MLKRNTILHGNWQKLTADLRAPDATWVVLLPEGEKSFRLAISGPEMVPCFLFAMRIRTAAATGTITLIIIFK